ncbi:MAG: asparagine synthase (glutamine-hydrolyzing) [Elusimicrobiaceae bacterium]|nr:asparagine synthase (glutamine-hydrolyzing) [Elusimicrobiaceae bacterium]
MCGICGIISSDLAVSPDRVKARLCRMRGALAHRGPDDDGEFFSGPAALGFRRLSILDLENGHQPMVSPCGKYAIVFNGEIYNHLELRPELEAAGFLFRTHADTETLLCGLMRHGAPFIRRLSGMFAFMFWDETARRVIISRDHAGIKPCYYSVQTGEFVFSSELRSLLEGGVKAEWDYAAVGDYLRFGFVHSPSTVFRGIKKLPPGHYAEFALPAPGSAIEPPQIVKYHTVTPCDDAREPDFDGAVNGLDAILNASVKRHLLSDVPVGAFLSGGVDSSVLAAMMVRHAGGRVKTFSIGFTGARRGMDESAHALAVARHIGSRHYPLMLDAGVLARIPELMRAMDEPIGDSALLPTLLLSDYARKEVKAVLSGEGADELFGGYNRYKAAALSYRVNSLPEPVKEAVRWYFSRWGKNGFFRAVPFKDKTAWTRAAVHSGDARIKELLAPEFAARLECETGWMNVLDAACGEGFNGVLLSDLRTVLADCLLMKSDKATMAAGIEARVPFLDPAVIEFAYNLPPGFKIRRFKSKWILRALAGRYVPENIALRSKHGFWAPWEEWIGSDPAELHAALETPALAEIFDTRKFGSDLRDKARGGRGHDAGLMFRAGILALWRASLRTQAFY